MADVRVPWSEVVSLPADPTPNQVREAVVEHGHSRFAVDDATGDRTGYVHLKDVFDFRPDQYDQPIPAKRMRRLITVPEDAELEDALARMRSQGTHLARTVDREGQTQGVIFLEDILEILVGEVVDTSGGMGRPGAQ